MKKLIVLLLLLLAAYFGYQQYIPSSSSIPRDAGTSPPSSITNDEAFANAFKYRTNNLQIEGSGTVLNLLPDDTKGSRHQRFIVKLNSGQTLLVAHNIDLAPRVDSLRQGDRVKFYGKYEWNGQGGVIHWTHLDPSGSHVAGWIHHNGKTYQ
ncbi:MAG: DUF3465 domain-containing protein [Desulforhopalus sp.]